MSLSRWFSDNFGGPVSLPATASMIGSGEQIDLSPPPKPRLAAVRAAPSREDFAAWRDQPVTQFVMAALLRNAEECREEWVRQSWDAGFADEKVLTGLRERADALLGFTADYDAFCETLNLEPGNE